MRACWEEKPEDRPTFTEMHEFLSELLSEVPTEGHHQYSYIRDCTKDIPDGYVTGAYECDKEVWIKLWLY